GHIYTFLKSKFPSAVNDQNPMIRMGFWPGGDRDGNPFVKADTTIKVASALSASAIKSYYLDVRKLKRRLTFKVVDQLLAGVESKLYKALFFPHQKTDLTQEEILGTLNEIRENLIAKNNSLFLGLVDQLIN